MKRTSRWIVAVVSAGFVTQVTAEPCIDDAPVLSLSEAETAVLRQVQQQMSASDFGGEIQDTWFDGFVMGAKPGTSECEIVPIDSLNETPTHYIAKALKYAVPATGTSESDLIVYVNGIRTPHEMHCKTLVEIADAMCTPVLGILNATNGAASDILQTYTDKSFIRRIIDDMRPLWGSRPNLGRNKASTSLAIAVLQNAISNQLREEEGVAPVNLHLVGHSQGGPTIRTGLVWAQNELATRGLSIDDLKVTTLAAAEWDWPDGPTYDHYVHCWDATPRVLGLGCTLKADTWRSGWSLFGNPVTVTRFVGDVKTDEGLRVLDYPRFEMPSDIKASAHHDVLETYLPFWLQQNGTCQKGKDQ